MPFVVIHDSKIHILGVQTSFFFFTLYFLISFEQKLYCTLNGKNWTRCYRWRKTFLISRLFLFLYLPFYQSSWHSVSFFACLVRRVCRSLYFLTSDMKPWNFISKIKCKSCCRCDTTCNTRALSKRGAKRVGVSDNRRRSRCRSNCTGLFEQWSIRADFKTPFADLIISLSLTDRSHVLMRHTQRSSVSRPMTSPPLLALSQR